MEDAIRRISSEPQSYRPIQPDRASLEEIFMRVLLYFVAKILEVFRDSLRDRLATPAEIAAEEAPGVPRRYNRCNRQSQLGGPLVDYSLL
jgi:hypothetical protein